MPTQDAENTPTPAGPRPYWWPVDVPTDQLPDNLRAAVAGILEPAYEQLVVGARAGLEQSAGTTIVNLLWLEILQQAELGQNLMAAGHDLQGLLKHERAIGRLLRLAGAKMKASDFLLRLQAFREKLITGAARAAAFREQPSAATGEAGEG